MASSSTSSLTRYRPIILITTGAAAAFGAYLLYTSWSPPTELHRSNAVRRSDRRRTSRRPLRYPDGGVIGIRNRLNEIDFETTAYGEGTYHGITIPLTLRVAAIEGLKSQFRSLGPRSDREWYELLCNVQTDFVQNFISTEFDRRPLNPQEMTAILYWLDNFVDLRVAEAVWPFQDENERPEMMLDGIHETDAAETVAPIESHGGMDDFEETGQMLQRAVFHIAEENHRQNGVIHRGITCNQCDITPIRGVRWRCANCADFDLCSYCEADNRHDKTHLFFKVRIPCPYLGYPMSTFPSPYPGRPDMMPSHLSKKLITKLKKSVRTDEDEIEGIWEQFTCLANTQWPQDPNGIGWAIDRKAFDIAFVPRWSTITSAPNLIYDRVFSFYDSNNDSLVGFEEFLKGLDIVHSKDISTRLQVAFNGYDIDEDGYVTRRDLLRLFRAYFAIQRESTKDYIAVHTEALSVAGALETIRTGQPLASNFNEIAPIGTRDRRHPMKPRDTFGDPLMEGESVLKESSDDTYNRETFLEIEARTGDRRDVGPPEDLIRERWERRQFYVDQEEGFEPAEHIRSGAQAEEISSTAGADGHTEMPSPTSATHVLLDSRTENGNVRVPSTGRMDVRFEESDQDKGASEETNGDAATEPNGVNRTSRSSSRVRFQDDLEMETQSNASTRASTSSRPIGERWGGYEIPEAEKDMGRDMLYQITQQGFNELLDPLFREKEDLAMETFATEHERKKWKTLIDEHMRRDPNPTSTVALVAIALGLGDFQQEFRRVLRALADKHLDLYKELGPGAAILAYLEDVRVAECELLNKFRIKLSSNELEASSEDERILALEVQREVVKDIWDNITKFWDLVDRAPSHSEHDVSESEIVDQPLEALLAQAGYVLQEGESGPQHSISGSGPNEQITDAHLADARRRVQDMVHEAHSLPHLTAEIVHEEDMAQPYQDPTMPQFRPNTDNNIPQPRNTPDQTTLMSGALPNFDLDAEEESLSLSGDSSILAPPSPTSTSPSHYIDSPLPSPALAQTRINFPLIINGRDPVMLPSRLDSFQYPTSAEDIISMLQTQNPSALLRCQSIRGKYSPEDQAADHSAYMAAAKYFDPSSTETERRPPPWRLDRLVLLQKHEETMRLRGGPGRINLKEFEEVVLSDESGGKYRYVEDWLQVARM